MTDQERINHLERLLRSYTGDQALYEGQCRSRVVDRMARDPTLTVKDWAEVLHNGLAYGIWPWTR